MVENHHKLSSRIIGVLVVFFLVATTAIGMTLLISWQLEGAAAAINDAGSQRMRSYRIGYLLQQAVYGPAATAGELAEQARAEIAVFERVLTGLERGDPARPLFLPRDEEIRGGVARMRQQWSARIRPLVSDLLDSRDERARRALLERYDAEVREFVGGINALVLRMEHSYSRNTNILRSFQLGLVALALIGTIILIYYFFALVVRPVRELQEGIARMTDEDFSARVPVVARDELGELADGFNRMASRLKNLYETLEERVEEKTRSLAEKNHELSALYDIAAFLNEPASAEELCRGFIRRVMRITGAQGGTVRLYDARSDKLFLSVHEGVSQNFIDREVALCMGECLCGEAIETASPVVFHTGRPPPNMTLLSCKREGFQTASAFTVSFKKRPLGIYNLYFVGEREIGAPEIHLLETLGQHLGAAVENQRLVSRDKELAVSEERNLLAQELHDSIAQGLAFLNIKVQLLEDSLRRQAIDEALAETANIREGVQESYDDVRELLTHFRTRVREADLDAAIAAALKKFEGQTGIVARFAREGRGAPLPAEYETQVLHIVQESLSNVRKHARAGTVDVRVVYGLDAVELSVRDDGNGFDPAVAAAGGDQHVGLKIMKERAHRVGGRFTIASRPGAGSEVRLTLPRKHKEPA